jgi:hypothetical protein
VVPFLQWSDQPTFAAWLESRSAGVYLPPARRSADDFHAAIAAVLVDLRLKRGAAALAHELAQDSNGEHGRCGAAEAAMSALDAHFATLTHREPRQTGGTGVIIEGGVEGVVASTSAAPASLHQPAEVRSIDPGPPKCREQEIELLHQLRALGP